MTCTTNTHLKAFSTLREAFVLWHRAAESYSKPAEFRTYLNACIQALRNVTFALQKEKLKVRNFDTWYSNWQKVLKSDPVMKWCVSARNRIVKEGDLAMRSIASASYVNSYLEAPKNEFSANPFEPTEAVARKIAEQQLPSDLRKKGYLKVERRWIADDLPQVELLEALAYAFYCLFQMLTDVDEQLGPKLSGLQNLTEETFLYTGKNIGIDPSVLPRCMSKFSDWRIVWVKLPSMKTVHWNTPSKPLNVDTFENNPVVKKYKLYSIPEPGFSPTTPLQKQASYFLQIAKKMLKKDKHLISAVFLFNGQQRLKILQLEIPEYEDKYAAWETVAQEVKRLGATSVISIAESWSAPFDPARPSLRPVDSAQRKESILLIAASKDGEYFSINVPFERKWGRIRLKYESFENDIAPNLLQPIFRAWGLNIKIL